MVIDAEPRQESNLKIEKKKFLADLNPTNDLGQPFVLLFYVIFFREINEINDGFGRDEQMGVDSFQLLPIPIAVTDPPPGTRITVCGQRGIQLNMW